MKTKLIAILVGVVAATLPVWGHHAFAAEFDRNKPVTLDGTVVRMEWSNPHTWLYVKVTREGKDETWMVEGGAPGVMLRGNGFKKDSFPEGMHVVVRGSGAKDGSLRANASSIQFPDGRTLDAGSSGGSEKDKSKE